MTSLWFRLIKWRGLVIPDACLPLASHIQPLNNSWQFYPQNKIHLRCEASYLLSALCSKSLPSRVSFLSQRSLGTAARVPLLTPCCTGPAVCILCSNIPLALHLVQSQRQSSYAVLQGHPSLWPCSLCDFPFTHSVQTTLPTLSFLVYTKHVLSTWPQVVSPRNTLSSDIFLVLLISA